ncbi:pro-corazonin-like [Eupeodes corollae]|uniref:pro-corazonin-like n=1 Tax=Eupeodes corollae TaxID=290404 RepID=UPI0024903F38|nr:pro-corazonin-like [Eupeodes corollae]
MLRFVVFSLVSFVVIISCMGQTFQYSRGWTNGKRSPAHLHEDPTMAEIFEVPESERRLEKCIIQLQRLIHNPYFLRPQYVATNSNGNSGTIRHQSNEILEDLGTSETGEFSTKHK